MGKFILCAFLGFIPAVAIAIWAWSDLLLPWALFTVMLYDFLFDGLGRKQGRK